MPQQIPEWWLNLSGAFFGLSILLLIALLVVAIYLIGAIKQITKKIELLAVKVDEIGGRVSSLVGNVSESSKAIGSTAHGVMDNISIVTRAIAGKAEIIGSAITVALVARQFLRARRK
ncbi:MAG: hypothetical protein JNJ45_03675 [Chthonomonas sp.]|nr:hypothetical protein [Chthonomonas sp.]